jgi:S-DNA-T family DNA segregation ATPase FtsK/SpoIIIE
MKKRLTKQNSGAQTPVPAPSFFTLSESMQKEIIGTVLFFLVILTLVSLISYSPTDPSLNHAGADIEVRNLFGIMGSYLSGILVGLFGVGAFWIPIVLLLASVRFLGQKKERNLKSLMSGGFILVITTGVFFSMISEDNACVLFGHRFSSGGLIGVPLTTVLLKYANRTGGSIIVLVMVIIGLILSTDFSIVGFLRNVGNSIKRAALFIWTSPSRIHAFITDYRARRELKKLDDPYREDVRKNRKDPEKKRPEPAIKISAVKPKAVKVQPVTEQEEFEFMKDNSDFKLPGIGFLNNPKKRPDTVDDENLKMHSKLLEKKLEDFGVFGQVSAVSPGPVITTYEYKPAPGVKINKIVNLSDDLALALRAISIRIVAPIPGKDAIGIEIPNETRESVCFKEIVTSAGYMSSKSPLTICLGHDIVGNPVSAELDKMPHLLIAGATGAGKSVGLNVMISSILFRATPDDVRMIMIDPKRIELSVYDGIPHLITPVVTDMKKATNALFWAVREMERRYELLAELKTRNIGQYNKKVEKEFTNGSLNVQTDDDASAPEHSHEKLPYIVIIIDELADLMMVASRDVEVSLTRLAQMARACGMHIILATQRPSVDVLTGIIKANFPTRISFQVSSKIDSRTIIDSNGAESLLGMGDMLYLPPGTAKLQRIHGAYISDEELNQLIEFWKNQKAPEYDESILKPPPEKSEDPEEEGDYDEKYDEAVALVTKTRQASISSVQRHLRIGYNRAARIIETMEKEGIIGPADGAKPREILVNSYDN